MDKVNDLLLLIRHYGSNWPSIFSSKSNVICRYFLFFPSFISWVYVCSAYIGVLVCVIFWIFVSMGVFSLNYYSYWKELLQLHSSNMWLVFSSNTWFSHNYYYSSGLHSTGLQSYHGNFTCIYCSVWLDI